MALVAGTLALCRIGAGVGFVDDDQVGAGPQEVVAVSVGLDEVHGHDRDRVRLEDGRADRKIALQSCGGRGEHQLGVQMELLVEFSLPLLRQVRGAEHRKSGGVSGGEQFLGDEPGFHGLADADVIRDEESHGVELERHEQWDELVGARLDGDVTETPERTRAGTHAEAQRVAQQTGGAVVAQVVECGRVEGGWPDLFDSGQYAGDLGVGAAERACDDEVVGAVGQHDPVTAACSYEGSNGEAHRGVALM